MKRILLTGILLAAVLVLIVADRIQPWSSSLESALSKGGYPAAAEFNAERSQEAFSRAYHVLKAWEGVRADSKGLLPRGISDDPEDNVWLAKDNAADLLPFLIIASRYLDPENEKLWVETMNLERRLCGPMPCDLSLEPLAVLERDTELRIFGASEYAKDGLLALAEWLGEGPWVTRMVEVEDQILQQSQTKTEYGVIPASGTEVNGEMLMVLSRLYWKTGDEKYLKAAERIADAYVFEMFPHSQGIPMKAWDFKKKKPTTYNLRLQDHAGEIVPGLIEFYGIASRNDAPKVESYKDTLNEMLLKFQHIGRNPEGLWVKSINLKTGVVPRPKLVTDTWGYLLNAYTSWGIISGDHDFDAFVRDYMKVVTRTAPEIWYEGHPQDGLADSLEGMITLLPWFPLDEGEKWIDKTVKTFFSYQKENGFVDGWYLDGNFIRTALLYAFHKTQGILPVPWREDLRLGAIRDKETGELHVSFSAEEPWQGRLKFDIPGRENALRVPYAYPRLNAPPRWMPIDPKKSYVVRGDLYASPAVLTGMSLMEGLSVTLHDAEKNLRFIVSEKV